MYNFTLIEITIFLLNREMAKTMYLIVTVAVCLVVAFAHEGIQGKQLQIMIPNDCSKTVIQGFTNVSELNSRNQERRDPFSLQRKFYNDQVLPQIIWLE